MYDIKDEIICYMKTIEEFDKDSAQDGNALHAYLIELTNVMARCNYLMAEYKRANRIQKKEAYLKLIGSSQANARYFSASLAKDFIESSCYESAYIYELAERTSRLATHTIDAVRTIVSALKSERQFAQYGT